MNCSRKHSTILKTPFIFAGIILSLFGNISLYSENKKIEITEDIKIINEYEQSGDYANALESAKNAQDYINISSTVKRLEKKLLTLGYSQILFDKHFKPKAKLLQLLDLFEIDNQLTTIEQINAWAQKNLLRQGERWEKQRNEFEKLKTEITPLLRDLGFIEATYPHFNEYQGAIIHGALLSRVRLRLHYLVKQWENGVRFTHLYFLSGERFLNKEYENKESLISDSSSLLKIKKDWKEPTQLPQTEHEMTKLVWDQSDIPDDMRTQVTVHFINAPMKKDVKTKKNIRPTTNDTVKEWLKTYPPIGRYLAITNAPYTNRQDLVIRTIAPDIYGFDTIGSKANQEEIAIFLDELARLIFQTKQLSEK
jgi:hypothetical protein